MRISDWSSDVCSSDLNKVINDQVIDAMAALPREQFVPKAYRGVAYMDEDVAVASGRFLMEPLVLARLRQEAALQQIGRASGRDRVCQYVEISVVAVFLKKKTQLEGVDKVLHRQ